MWKKSVIVFVIIILFILGIVGVIKITNNKKIIEDNQKSTVQDYTNQANLADNSYVTDDCIDEWKDYAKTVEEELKQASNISEDENTKYTIKNENDYVTIYKIEENGEEALFKTTTINTKYLTDEDLEILDQGIEIIGREELNRLLEDFE